MWDAKSDHYDMTVRQARGIRKTLKRIIDSCDVYPRKGTFVDSVSLALFLRMCEVHETICILVGKGLHRDAVVLGRGLCESAITHYWMTNKDVNRRFDRYVHFLGKIQKQNIAVVEKHYGHKQALTKEQLDLVRETEKHFKNFGKQWNDVKIGEMAYEADAYETLPDGSSVNMAVSYDLFYWWFSLLAHPSIEAIQNFLPPQGSVFRSSRKPTVRRTLQEDEVLFLSTTWLLMIASRIDTVMSLGQDKEFEKTLLRIRKSK